MKHEDQSSQHFIISIHTGEGISLTPILTSGCYLRSIHKGTSQVRASQLVWTWNWWFSCYRLRVTMLRTLATFRPDALVFFRAKVEVSTRGYPLQMAALKRSEGAANRRLNRNFRRQTVASSDTQWWLVCGYKWIAPCTNFHFCPEEDQSIWLKR